MTHERSARSWTNRVKLAGGVLLGVGLLGWFLGGLHWSELGNVLRDVSPGWLGLAVLVMLADYAIHAWRWGILLRDVDPDADFELLWGATAIGWAFNTLLPFRAGNFVRPAVVALRRPVSYTTVLFTTVAEYVCDAVGIVLMVLWMIWLLPAEMLGHGILADVKVWGTWTGVAALALVGVVVLLSSRQAREVVQWAVRPVPSERVRRRMLGTFDELVAGMASVGNPIRLLQALVLTIAYWGGWLVGLVVTLRAFHLELPLAGALFMEAALTLSMMVPQAPGFLGVFHVVTEKALALWGTPTAQAEGIALVFWTVVFVPITLVGLFEGWRRGLDVVGGRRAVLEELAEEEGIRPES